MKNTTTMKTYTLPAELANGLIHNDWSVLDDIDDTDNDYHGNHASNDEFK